MTNMCMMKLAMTTCEQTEGMTIMEHGESVAEWYKDIRNYIRGGTLKREWRLPDWINDPIIDKCLLPDDIMETYQIYHDCGKPFCIEWDDEGKRHFPNHAKVSEETWLNAGGDPQVGRLIGMDMDIHLLKDVGVKEFAKRPEAISLLITGLAEIHSNADMFGGIESTSFKIKYKQIAKRGKRIIEELKKGE